MFSRQLCRFAISILIYLGCFVSTNIHLYPYSQVPEQQYISRLQSFSGNKLLMMGSWSAHEKTAWDALLDEESIYDFDIKTLVTSDRGLQSNWSSFDPSDIDRWLRDKYAHRSSRWVILNAQNQAVAHGINIPKADELTLQLEKAGLVSLTKQLQSFLREYPDHLEARTEILQHIRRRAKKLTTQKIHSISGTESLQPLDPETDHVIWGSFAQAVDEIFRFNWQGLVIPFFRVEEDVQIEKYSPTMKAVFARHIAKVETALIEAPISQSLWDIWGWMARSMENRDWKKLLNNLEVFSYPGSPTCPAPNVAVWLTREAKVANDWEQVVKLAKSGMKFYRYPDKGGGGGETAWFPGQGTAVVITSEEVIDGYPINSSFMPMLEGLLRLNRLEEANNIFEDILFYGGMDKREAMVNLASITDRPSLAQEWRTKVLDTSVPRHRSLRFSGMPTIVRYNARGHTPQSLEKIPSFGIGEKRTPDDFGWTGPEERWALLDKNDRIVVEGEGNPHEGQILQALKAMNYKTPGELAREYLRDFPDNALAQLILAYELCTDARIKTNSINLNATDVLEDNLDHQLFGECAKLFLAIYENKSALHLCMNISNSYIYQASGSNLMKAVAKVILPKLEAELQQQPMSPFLWKHWMAWRHVGGNIRSFALLLEDLVPSPLVAPGQFPPIDVMNEYYNECVSQERWSEATRLLREPWERELATLDNMVKQGSNINFSSYYRKWQTWQTCKLLITALLHDGKSSEAGEIVVAWTSRGGKFENASDIIELARKLSYKTLADTWEKM